MNEKAKTLHGEDYGKDLAGVQALLRRHEELEKDLTAIEDKLEVSLKLLKSENQFLMVTWTSLLAVDNEYTHRISSELGWVGLNQSYNHFMQSENRVIAA